MKACTRDDSLDILKGLACLAMVIAHQPYFFKMPELAPGLIQYIAAAIPPTIFFAVAGVTAAFQASKYSLFSLTRYFLAMFLIGLTWNIAIHGDITAFYWVEIFQIIALGSLCVCVVEHHARAPQWLLFTLSAAIIFIKLIVETYCPQFDGWNYLFCDTAYVWELSAAQTKNPVLPGFPLFPWLAYFFLGAWCYRLSKHMKLIAAIAALIATLICVYFGSSIAEKWDSPIAHILADITLMVIAFWLFDGYSIADSRAAELLQKIGSNAFLFFFAHPFGLAGGVIIFATTNNAYLAWAISIVVSIASYNLLAKIKPSKAFDSRSAWLVMISVIVLLPLSTLLIKHDSALIITRLLAIVIGTITAVNFNALSRLTKVSKKLQ
ncbi:MAG: heparan-alpha-glucosaminide N-acetyltransferase domain-containing protein [Spongiibacteraceae bacterium]